jgi:molybdenum cofactor guanylyltransferase
MPEWDRKHIAGIVVCGGKSTRMGTDKASLIFDGRSMLDRVTSMLARLFDTIVVVAAPDQTLPPLSIDVIDARDQTSGRGPLEGIRAGLSALPNECTAAYVSSCDVPLLQEEFVRFMVQQLENCEIVVPETDGFKHPLAAMYRTSVVPQIESLLANDQLRPIFLYEKVKTRIVDQATLEKIDPDLISLMNLNSPADVQRALEVMRQFDR